jgi:hypothetical protein
MGKLASTAEAREAPTPRSERRRSWTPAFMLAFFAFVDIFIMGLVLTLLLVGIPLRKERVTRTLLLKAGEKVPKGCRLVHVCN